MEETERIRLGLRKLKRITLDLEKARAYEAGKGLGICGLGCGYKGEPDVIRDLSFTAYPVRCLGSPGTTVWERQH